MFRLLFALPLLSLVGCLNTGCSVFNKQPQLEPIQNSVAMFTTEVIKPAMEKIAAETSARTAQLQGQGSLINPGYQISGFAGLFQGIHYNLAINTVGVSANLAGATQADAGQAAPVRN